MLKKLRPFLLLAALALTAGCSSNYWAARGRDAADIFTFTIGPGMAAKARVGPVQVAPVSMMHDSIGLRSGEFVLNKFEDGIKQNYEQYFLLPPDFSGRSTFGYYIPKPVGTARHKAIDEVNAFPLIITQRETRQRHAKEPAIRPQATQVEVALGVIFCVRVGVNIGEFFDFIVGWFGVDLYNDDEW